jgi:hypothetical protein
MCGGILMEIWEVLAAVDKQKSRAGKAKVLMDNDTVALRSVMRINFDPDLIIYVSDDLEWTPAPHSGCWYTTLKNETRNLVPLVRKGAMPQERADYKFISILESMDPRDANILMKAKDKKLKVNGLTLRLAEEIWGRRIFN